MAWTFAQSGGTESSGFPGGAHKIPEDEWLVATEVVTLTSGSASDQSTSVIDFIPYGKDWVIEVDPSATLATSAEIDIDYCNTKDGTFSELATTTTIEANPEGTVERANMDNSSIGNRPYYKLRMDKDGSLKDNGSTTVTFTVLVPPRTGVIY